ncbi:hypothetical protein L596_027465 [Steinernema carpocapsae]|uniref:Uncharacterized protein n=1 Tax=Steinernema carpocapsae TaxID=34508 RepID=A0A4U5LVJ3_STECR|nr:hypothetical protein L596_027465 [Steinernema carpocapsae]
MSLFYLMNRTILLVYRHYNTQLKEAIEEKLFVLHPEEFTVFSCRQLGIMNIVREMADNSTGFLSMTIFCGIRMNVGAVYTLAAFWKNITWW